VNDLGSAPDVTAGAGVRHFEDNDGFAAVVELSAPLPLVDRNQGAALAARYQLARARTQRRAAEVAMHESFHVALQQFEAARFEAVTLQREALPAARSAFDAVRSSFQQGRSDYIEVLDAERTLVEVERQAVDAFESHYLSHAEVDGLLAGAATNASPTTGTSGESR